jgi:hypothetical protein
MIRAVVREIPLAVRVRRSIVGLVGASALVAACSNDHDDINAPAPRYDLVLAVPTGVAVGQDSTVSLDAALTDSAGTAVSYAVLSYESSDDAVAEVDDEGNVTGRSGGTATVTVTYDDVNRDTTLMSTVPVTVRPHPAASITAALPANARTPAGTIYVGEARRVLGSILSATGDTLYCPVGSGTGGTCTATVIRPNASGAGVDTLDRVVREVVFTTSVDTALVRVSANGTVTVTDTAAAPAAFTVTMTSPGDPGAPAATVNVSVAPRPVTTVVVAPSPAAVAIGEELELTVTPLGRGDAPIADRRGRAVTFTSSNPAVATVDEEGVVTGIAAGTATITASVETTPGSATRVAGSTDVIVR